jgi:hypothetical protein
MDGVLFGSESHALDFTFNMTSRRHLLSSHIKSKGFTGVIGMEHGNATPSKEGEADLIAAYRSVDPI